MSEYTIFGSEISAFTRKLEAAFECYGVDFVIKRKTPEIKDALEGRSGTHQIPVLRTPENWILADTSPIMMLMDSRYPHRRLYPLGINGVLVHILEEVLDEWMVRAMVHFRWHYDDNTVFVISRLTGNNLDIETARQHQLAQWGLRSCRATGTESVAQQAYAEKEYFSIVEALEEQLSHTSYALGACPTAVDTILMGTYRGHTNFDPSPDMSRFKRIAEWNSRDHSQGQRSELDAFANPSPFVQRLLTIAREQYAPFALANKRALDNGDKAFVINTYGEDVSYLAREYPERSRRMIVQRIQHQLSDTERQQLNQWLDEQGLAACFSDKP